MTARRNRPAGFVVGVCALLTCAIGCGDADVRQVDKSRQSAAGQSQAAATGSPRAAGVTWTVPAAWEQGGPRPMRVATYLIGSGDAQAECAVFFFGTGQGGDVKANVERWIGQFVQPDGSDSHGKARIGDAIVSGLPVTTIDLTGTYTGAMGGPMSGMATGHPGWRLLGAIVAAPEGPVFFKLTGPGSTVTSLEKDFDTLVASVRKG